MVMAVMCANSDPRLLAGMHDLKILPVATIIDSPDTVGLADSNLMRLGSTAEIDKELDMMQSIGVKDIRIGLFWSQIQPLPGVFNWETADYIVNQADARGMGVLAVLNQTPVWAGTPVNSGTPSTTDFANYATAVAQRYQGKLSAVEIWNEPNASFFLNPISPSNYTGLLQAGYNAIKAVDPSITVIGGVLGAGVTAGNITMSPQEFLQGMYDAGAHGYFDALSFHPYGNGQMYSQQPPVELLPKGQLQALRALMNQYGDAAKQIWATEYGLPTGTTSNMVTQQQQAEFIADFLNSWGEQAGVGPIFLYTTRDLDTGTDSAQDNFGLWETDWTPKQVVQVVQDFIAAHAAPPSGNPIIDAIKNFIVKGAQLVGAVIKGAVDLVVGGVKAIAAAVVWVVTAGAKVVANIAKGIGNLITGVVDRVVGCVEHIFGGAAAAAAAKPEIAAATSAAFSPSQAKVAGKADAEAKDRSKRTAPADNRGGDQDGAAADADGATSDSAKIASSVSDPEQKTWSRRDRKNRGSTDVAASNVAETGADAADSTKSDRITDAGATNTGAKASKASGREHRSGTHGRTATRGHAKTRGGR